MKIDYEVINDVLGRKLIKEHEDFSCFIDEDMLKINKSDTFLALSKRIQTYVDNQIMNFESAFKLYVDVSNKIFVKYTEQIKNLKQEVKEMQQAIGKIVINMYNQSNKD